MLDSEEKPSQLISLRATSEIAKRCERETYEKRAPTYPPLDAACEKTLEFGSFEPLIRRIADSDADVQRCCFVAIEQLARQGVYVSLHYECTSLTVMKTVRATISSNQN